VVGGGWAGGGTFEQGDEISFNSFLQSTDSGRLESQVGFEVLSNFSDETLETRKSQYESHTIKVAG
jgi:hypothetical protein